EAGALQDRADGLGARRPAGAPAPGPAVPVDRPAAARSADPGGLPREIRGRAPQGPGPGLLGAAPALPPRGRPEGGQADGRGGPDPGERREGLRGERVGRSRPPPSEGGQAMRGRNIRAAVLLGVAALLLPARPAGAYIEASYTLGRIVQECTNILVMVVDKVDKQNNRILYKKVRDLKGTHPTDIIRHNIAQAGFHP